MDRSIIGSIQNIHEFEVLPAKGKHLITVIDELGNGINRDVEILD